MDAVRNAKDAVGTSAVKYYGIFTGIIFQAGYFMV